MRASTHEVADMLMALAKLLKRMPDGPMNDLVPITVGRRDSGQSTSDKATALLSLIAFSKFSKREWVELIHDLDLPITPIPTDSSRDLMGKIIKFLSENPIYQNKLLNIAKSSDNGKSSELLKTLSLLVK